ncbi:MAG: rRNA maturation RNase YbeY [Alphaproteobacteria bacterium]|nr:rRNA maturation RNase YbeY [Alphaproteobacteria bacterium]HPF46562.1 rRNA maturation RNase YbeY [Emcibacteraceae bacterium]
MSFPDGLNLEISVDYDQWQEKLPGYKTLIEKALEQIIKNVKEGKFFSNFSLLELSIVLCDNQLIHQLNKDFRNQDKPTNVLSFNGLEADEIERYLKSHRKAPEHPYSLGEIYIAYEIMVKEAKEAEISFEDHFTHLVIHGILHLLGYDHIEDQDAEVMENLESSLLANLGIDDPYSA